MGVCQILYRRLMAYEKLHIISGYSPESCQGEAKYEKNGLLTYKQENANSIVYQEKPILHLVLPAEEVPCTSPTAENWGFGPSYH